MYPEGLDVKFTRHKTGKPRHLSVFSRQNRVFSRHKQMSGPSGKDAGMLGSTEFSEPRGTGQEFYPSNEGKNPSFAAVLFPFKIWVFSRPSGHPEGVEAELIRQLRG